MKLAVLLTLTSTLISAQAAENFGGISFHSSVPMDQVEALKTDLTYLYKTPVKTIDKEFKALAQLPAVDGPNMHNWLINRVRYIVGEEFKLDESNVIGKPNHVFPKTPTPKFGMQVQEDPEKEPEPETKEEDGPIKTIMVNIGGALYIAGKNHNTLLGIKFDGEEVYATSGRTGILQVGEGLFMERFALNKDPKAPANSINRLATLFHEARHSDGNSLGTGFMHAYCPLAHPYGGHAACESFSNGPYTVGALATRQLLKECTTCSTEEKSKLEVTVLDSFSRVLTAASNATHTAEVVEVIKVYREILGTYKEMQKLDPNPANQEKYKTEIAKIETLLKMLEQDLVSLKAKAGKNPEANDPTPEGDWTPVTLEQSKKMMGTAK